MTVKGSKKERLDVLLVSRGLVESREQAKRFIMAGNVIVAGVNSPKPGLMVAGDTVIELKEKERFVSRGGLKLQEALEAFSIGLTGRVCVDVGASTGGFTDCMVQNGARLVYAVDVGASQMHERVRRDERVKLVEHTNARNLRPEMFPELPEFAAVDVSFISVLHISAVLPSVLAGGKSAVILIKPQFEAGRDAVSRGRGVIRDETVHREVLEKVLGTMVEQGWQVKGLIPSPIAGGSGNIEFLVYLQVGDNGILPADLHIDIDDVVSSARARFL